MFHEVRQTILGEATHSLSFDSWQVAGPFDGVRGAGLEAAYPPEQGVDLHASYRGKSGAVRWQRFAADDRGYLDLLQSSSDGDDVVCYAYREFDSPAEQEATVLLGSDDGARLWVNGALVYTHRAGRSAVPDEDAVPVRLKQGRNRLLLKVINEKGEHGFYLRVESPQALRAAD